MRKSISRLLPLALLCAFLAYGADWPKYAGPDRDNVSREEGLLQEWPESGPEQVWRRSLGAGFGGAAVRDGKVYVLDRVDRQKDVFICMDLESGEELWSQVFNAPGKTGFNGSRIVPTVTEDYIFGVGLMGDFYCLERKSGRLLWKKNVVKDFGGKKVQSWGASQSPFVHGDSVLVAVHGESVRIISCDQRSGEIIWQSEPLSKNTKHQYTSPVVLEIAGSEQVVMTAAGEDDGVSVGLDPESGRKLWSFDHWKCKIPIPTPIKVSGDRLFFTGGYGAGSAMVRIVENDSGYEVEKVFQLGPECGSQIHLPILHEGHIYINSNSNRERDGMTCLDLDGKILWQTGKSPNFERGNLILADGKFYNLDGQTGILHLIQPEAAGYREVSSFQALDGKQIWAPMAISDCMLIIRDQDEMKCFSIKN